MNDSIQVWPIPERWPADSLNLRTKLPHSGLRVVKPCLEPPVGFPGLTPESLPGSHSASPRLLRKRWPTLPPLWADPTTAKAGGTNNQLTKCRQARKRLRTRSPRRSISASPPLSQ